ncbi:MAG: DNA-binding response regulator [Chloroflexi bacterium HGW-Chloroflexi-6]|nr:MAG: DNA-binding response regulator [Chloroflexi bacterium HGW-Chloroflexi-6]
MITIKTLLADDHALIRAGLRDALTSLPGIEIVGEVGNGPDLVQALETLQPTLLVMDVNMPDFEPVAAVQQMRVQYPALKILVVSAYDDQSYVVGLLSAGVNGYHLKDQPLSDLHLAVRRILDGGRWISDPLVNRLVDQHSAPVESVPSITRRQRELLYLLTQGYNNQKIAWVMDLSIKTIENHLTALYRAIGVESRLEANNYANKHPEVLLVPESEKQGRPEIHGESLNVLVLDDNPRYRAQLAKLLGKTWPQASVHEANDCQEAVRLAEKVKPRLAFIDVVLKEEDGIQCARRIKSVSPTTLMVLISAYPDREFRRMGLNAGAVAFLDKKDIDAATVRQVVEDALAR